MVRMGRYTLLLALLVAAHFPAIGQSMELVSGNMSVASGTRISISGPVVWTVFPGAQLVNDGRILLGEQASLVVPRKRSWRKAASL